MAFKFSELSIKARIFAGFGLTLLLVMIEGGFSVSTTTSIVSDVEDADHATVLISELQTLSVSTSDLLSEGSQNNLDATITLLDRVGSDTASLVSDKAQSQQAAQLVEQFRLAAESYSTAFLLRNSQNDDVQSKISELIAETVSTANQSNKSLSAADQAVFKARTELDTAQGIIDEAHRLIIAMNNVELAMVLFDGRQSKSNQKKLLASVETAKGIVDIILKRDLDTNTRSVVSAFTPFIEKIQSATDEITKKLAEAGELTKKDKLGLIKAKITARKAVKIATGVMEIQNKKMEEARNTVVSNRKEKTRFQGVFDTALGLQANAFSLLNDFSVYVNTPTSENSENISKQLNSLALNAQKYAERVSDEAGSKVNTIVSGFSDSHAAFVETQNKAQAARVEMKTSAKSLTELVSAIGRERVDSVISSGTTAANIILIVTIVVTAFSVLLFLYAGRLLHTLTRGIRRLAQGDLETSAESGQTERNDEIGEMARAIQAFQDKENERQELAAKSEAEQASRIARAGQIEDLIADFRTTAQTILSAVTNDMDQMQLTAQHMNTMATDTSEQASSAVRATDNASMSVQTVAAAAEELSASITEISRQVSKTTEVVGNATANTRDTNEKISSLAEAAQKIGDVVTLIQDIAEQTNLLALNATIEAARAGDMGKGFAVVASEVKSLATQTAKATEEIAGQISEIQGSTEEAVIAIQEIVETMDGVNSYTTAIASAVEEQGAATAEISQNVSLAANATQDAASNMATVSESVTETSNSANKVQSTSSDASERAKKLRETVDHFLQEVASA